MTNKQRSIIIEAAIIGLQAQRDRLTARIAELRAQRDGATTTAQTDPSSGPRRRVSAAARRRIAEAQRRRWALIRKRALAA